MTISDQYLVIEPTTQRHTPLSGTKISVYNFSNGSYYWVTPEKEFKFDFENHPDRGPLYGLFSKEFSLSPKKMVSEKVTIKDSVYQGLHFKNIVKNIIYEGQEEKKVTTIEHRTYLRENDIPELLSEGISTLFQAEYLAECGDSSRYFLTHYHALDTFENTHLSINNLILDAKSIAVVKDDQFNRRIDSLLFNAKSISKEKFMEINGRKD